MSTSDHSGGTGVESPPADEAGDAKPQGRLLSVSFIGLLVTQLLGAANDNVLRWLVIGIGKDFVDASNISVVLMAGTACFVLPYLLLAAPAGYFADRYSKRTVIVACKFAEVIIMLLAVGAILAQSLTLLLIVVALMGAQSALFGPAKMGSIPEMLKSDRISAANGYLGLTTVAAVVVGMGVGSWLAEATGERGVERWWYSAAVLVGLAVIGWLTSLAVMHLKPANPRRRFPWDAPMQTVRDLRSLSAQRPMFRVALGIMFFWALGALYQLNIDQLVAEGLAEGLAQNEMYKVPLLLSLVAGLGVGSVLAGLMSAGRVELGILPLAAGGMAFWSVALFFVNNQLVDPAGSYTVGYGFACTFLFLLGTSAGMFDVPLNAYMQHRSPPESRGSILAASNFMTFGGILVTALLFAALRPPIGNLEARQIFLLCGIITVPVMFYIIWLIPQAIIRFIVWVMSKIFYRIRVYGRENLPEQGGALLVSNHVSFLDGGLLLLTSSRPIRMFADARALRGVTRWIAQLYGVILVKPGPKGIRRALDTANQALKNGELVCIFPEGGITRSGQLQSFRPGLMKILKDTSVPVVPVFLDELWGSIFSFRGGKFFWKWPEKLPYPISIFFGPPVHHPEDVHEVRQAVAKLGTDAVEARVSRMQPVPRQFVRTCKRRKFVSKVADSTGASLTGGSLLMRSLILRRLLRRHVLADDEQYVGVLLPPTVGGFVANMALALDRCVTVNLNYTVSSDVLNQCCAQSGIKHILTSRKFMSKMGFELDAELVYLEDFRKKVTRRDKLAGMLASYACPSSWLERSLGLHKIRHDDILTVIFTSGSEGTPKGVMLSHGNIASNVDVVESLLHLNKRDVLIGILPFFHSFGYTVTLWSVATLNVKGAYHYNPLEAQQVGELTQTHRGTVFLTTPTFLRTYLRRCTPEQLSTLDVIIAGAEKLPSDLSDAFEKRFGVRPVEGYGTTELSPLVSVNIPPSRSHNQHQVEGKEGTVGRPIPGVTAKIVNPDTGETLGVDRSGMLWVSGPNVMQGYLGQPEKTAEVVQDGWYMTGDIALIDKDGFIRITGRVSRFSKIGGEMIPHIQIKCALNDIIHGDDEERAELKAAVTAVPDPKKGERLIVLHTRIAQTPEQLCAGLSEAGLPNIFIPSPDSFVQVEELPFLGSGKLDLKGMRRCAREHFE